MANIEDSFMVAEWTVEPGLDKIIGYSRSTCLRSQVMELLVYLAKHQGEVVSLENLLNDLWEGKIVTDGTVYNCIAELRSVLSAGNDQLVLIETIPKKGYRLVASVRGLADYPDTDDRSEVSPSIFTAKSPFITMKRAISVVVIVGLLLVIMMPMLNRWSEEQIENPQSDHFTRRYTIDLPRSMRSENYEYRPVTITPDGRRIIFGAVINGEKHIFSRSLDSLNVVSIKGTENASLSLGVSPNGQWIAFVDERDGLLKKVPIKGGIPVTLCDPGARILALSWGPDDSIVYESNSYAGLMQVSSLGGKPEKLTFPTKGKFHKQPYFSAKGNSVFFTIGKRGVTTRKTDRIAVLSLQAGKQKVLMEGASPQLTTNGYLIYYRNHALFAVAFDEKQQQVSSESIPIAEGVYYDYSAHYSISTEGTLLYVLATILHPRNLVWVDRHGKVEKLDLERRAYIQPRISPKNDYVAVVVDSKNGADLWMYSLKHNTSKRLTFDESREASPIWSPDEKYIYYSSNRIDNLFRVSTDGKGEIEQLTDSSQYQFGYSITADGQRLLIDERADNFDLTSEANLAMIALFDKSKSDILLQTEFSDTDPALSPDGNWLAYSSDRSGQNEIYVSPFPKINQAIWQLSANGGRFPQWNTNGKELFYQAPENLMSVKINTEPKFEAAQPRKLFNHSNFVFYGLRNFDVDPAGKRFLMVRKPSEEEFPNNQIVIVQDWLNDLAIKKLSR